MGWLPQTVLYQNCRQSVLLPWLLLSLFWVGCDQAGISPPPGVANNTRVAPNVQGEWTGENEYKNEHFGIQLTIPEDWYFEKGMNEAAADMGADILVGDDEAKRKTIAAAMKNTQTPFMAYRYPPGTPGKQNPNVICMIEKIAHLPGIKTPADYLLILEQTLKSTNVDVSFEGPPQTVQLEGLDFSQRIQSINMGFGSIGQRTYARKEGDYILLISVTFFSDEDETVIDELLNTISIIKQETP